MPFLCESLAFLRALDKSAVSFAHGDIIFNAFTNVGDKEFLGAVSRCINHAMAGLICQQKAVPIIVTVDDEPAGLDISLFVVAKAAELVIREACADFIDFIVAEVAADLFVFISATGRENNCCRVD